MNKSSCFYYIIRYLYWKSNALTKTIIEVSGATLAKDSQNKVVKFIQFHNVIDTLPGYHILTK